MARSLERITLLIPILVVTGITLAVTFVIAALARPAAAPPAQAVLAEIAASSEKAPVDARAIAALLAHVEGVGAVTVNGQLLAGQRAATVESELCTTIRTTGGPATLCAGTRRITTSIAPISAIAISAIAASLLAAMIATLLVRRSILRAAKAIDDRAPSVASGSLGALSASINRLLDHVNENEVVLRRRTLELESANKELEAFTFSASHDLRAPLASIDGFTQMLIEDCDTQLDDMARDCAHWIRDACAQMQELVEGLLQMSRFSRADIDREEVDLSRLAHSVADGLRQREPHRNVDVRIQEGVVVNGDRRLLRAVIENLLSNAWKFTRKRPHATIEFGVTNQNGRPAIYVRDDGAGFDPGYADKMFHAFQRLHTRQEFEGTGIGLSTVERILHRHGGRIWAEGEVEKGATFYFVIPSGVEGPGRAAGAKAVALDAPPPQPASSTPLGMTGRP